MYTYLDGIVIIQAIHTVSEMNWLNGLCAYSSSSNCKTLYPPLE